MKNTERTLKKKKREIFYANHLDAQVFTYYSYLINQKLDKEYSKDQLLIESVIAYRNIPFNEYRSKYNINFAKEVFVFIKHSKETELNAICFDIKSFLTH